VLIDVAFLPRDASQIARSVCIVVDVIRASTTMATLFDRRCPAIHVARNLDSGQRYARENGLLLCGERGGARPEGFDFGNSPSEFSELDFVGRAAVLCTTNGTVALHAVAGAPAVFAGCLVNASAVVAAAIAAAREMGNLTVVCAGRPQGRFALDDAWTAGRLAAHAARFEPDATLTDAARAAIALTQAFPGALEAFRTSASGQAVISLGLGDDLVFAAQEDRFSVAPRLSQALELPGTRWPVVLVPEG